MTGRGFTLIEVLVALAMVAVALIAGLRAVGVMAQSSVDLRQRVLAQLSARNQIALLRATRIFPPVGSTEVACPQGNLPLVCRQETKPTPNEFFRRVEVKVYLGAESDHWLAELVGILPREQ